MIAAIISANEAFRNSQLYVTKKATDEKAIALYIVSKSIDIPIILFELADDQTIQYYSRRPVQHLTVENGNLPAPPFYLVVPNPVIEQNPWLKKIIKPYTGEKISLFYLPAYDVGH